MIKKIRKNFQYVKERIFKQEGNIKKQKQRKTQQDKRYDIGVRHGH